MKEADLSRNYVLAITLYSSGISLIKKVENYIGQCFFYTKVKHSITISKMYIRAGVE